MEKHETLALLRHHAGFLYDWDVTSCDPVTINKQRAALLESAERTLALVKEYLAEPPAPKVKRKRRKARR